jgi:cyclase
VYAWVPERGVLFSGDLLFHEVTPLLAMGSIAGALDVFQELRQLGARVIVPGHGRVAGPDVIDDVEAYVRLVAEVAREGRAAGASPLEAARQADLGRFAEWPDRERLVGNLHRAYAELDGTPPGAPIDVRAAFADMVAFNDGQPLRCLA